MFFNISNYSCFTENTKWTTKLVQDANKIAGEVVDIGFPVCEPDMSNERLAQIAHATALDIAGTYRAVTGRVPSILHKDVAAAVNGHTIMSMLLVSELQDMNVPCYMAVVGENNKFVSFRKYPETIVGADKIAIAIAQG